jgi:hypothetical protein
MRKLAVIALTFILTIPFAAHAVVPKTAAVVTPPPAVIVAPKALLTEAPKSPVVVAPKAAGVKIVADCRPPAIGGNGSVGVRILSRAGSDEVQAIVYPMIDALKPTARRSPEQSYSIRDVAVTPGAFFTGREFFLKVAQRESQSGYVAGLSTRFQGRTLRERLVCELNMDRVLAARDTLNSAKTRYYASLLKLKRSVRKISTAARLRSST